MAPVKFNPPLIAWIREVMASVAYRLHANKVLHLQE